MGKNGKKQKNQNQNHRIRKDASYYLVDEEQQTYPLTQPSNNNDDPSLSNSDDEEQESDNQNIESTVNDDSHLPSKFSLYQQSVQERTLSSSKKISVATVFAQVANLQCILAKVTYFKHALNALSKKAGILCYGSYGGNIIRGCELKCKGNSQIYGGRYQKKRDKDCMEEAGFRFVHFWIRQMPDSENIKSMEGFGSARDIKYEEVTSFQQQDSWNAYIVAVS
ncbi:hypothetical protein Tco_0943815 [Tanacetum coccineum]